MSTILVFLSKDPAPYIQQLNQLYGYPKVGYKDGKPRTDGIGGTENYMTSHPDGTDKWFLRKEANTPQNIIDDADYELSTEEEMIADGWM